MMHNSLFIRDRLLETNQNPLHVSRRDPHQWLQIDPPTEVRAGETALTGRWSVVAGHDDLSEAAADLADFLSRCGTQVAPGSSQTVSLHLDSSLRPWSFRLAVQSGSVSIHGGDIAGVWAGLVYLEREVAGRRAPALPHGTTERAAPWRLQISQAPFGSNYLVPDLTSEYIGDDAFRLLAHYGINGMNIYGDWLLYVKSERFPALSQPDYDRNIAILKQTVARARKFGVQLIFMAVSPKFGEEHEVFRRHPELRGARIIKGQTDQRIHNLCSSSEASLALHRETFRNLFREVPDLGGLGLIIGGESYYHCFMRPDLHGLEPGMKTNCPLCAQQKPEDVVNRLLKATADGVHEAKPGAPVMAWPYSATRWSSDRPQLEFCRGMEPGVSLLTTVDKDQWYQKDGYRKVIWDYSIDYTGPADNLVAQAEVIRERGLDLYVKHETALGLECIHLPYMPALQRIGQKWANVRAMQPAGVMQSWMFFGMFGSRAEEIGWWTAWRPELSLDQILHEIAGRDFGPLAGDMVKVWDRVSRAAGHLPYIGRYFTGPEFIGPAHPLLPNATDPTPELFHALLYYLQENEETFSRTVIETKHSLVMNQLPMQHFANGIKLDREGDMMQLVLAEYSRACAVSGEALGLIESLQAAGAPVAQRLHAEERLLVEFVHRTFLSTYHTLRYLYLRDHGGAAGEADRAAELRTIALAEIENARLARHIFVEAPWLDLGIRVDGKFPSSLEMVDAKIALMAHAFGVEGAV